MSSDYFDSSDHQQVAATRARASAINNALDALDTGLALLPTEANIKRGLINYGVDSGAADAYVVTLPYPATALTDGMQVVFKASAVNTGACTINVDSLGVKSIKRHDGTDPVAGDIGTNKITELRYNSTTTTFEIQGNVGVDAGAGTMSAQNANAVAITGGTIAGATITGGTIGGASPLLGLTNRSKFTYVDGDTITVGGGLYDVDGTLAKITSALTTTAHGVTGADWAYLYIDYSSLPADNVLIQSDLIWATTEPTWSHTKLGWYNGSDRCIFACRIAVTSDDILEFTQNKDYVSVHDQINVQTETSFAATFAATSAFIVPSFCTVVGAMFFLDANAQASSCTFSYRPTGSSATSGTQIGATDEDDTGAFGYSHQKIIVGTGKTIDIKQTTTETPGIIIYEDGWYLPEGI